MSLIEQVPVVQRSDSCCTAHPRSDPLKRTTKRGTREKDRSKKNNERIADKIIALRRDLEGLKAEKSNAQQARRRADPEIRAARAEGNAKEYREKFIHSNKKPSSEICVPLGANFVNQPFCKSQVCCACCCQKTHLVADQGQELKRL